MTLFWISKLSRRNSTGKSLFALIPPTFAAATMTIVGRSSAKNFATADSLARSSFDRSRVSRFLNPSASSLRTSALPTIPRWPARKIFSDLLIIQSVLGSNLKPRDSAAARIRLSAQTSSAAATERAEARCIPSADRSRNGCGRE